MDRPIPAGPRRPGLRLVLFCALLAGLLLSLLPLGLLASRSETPELPAGAQLAAVSRGEFRDELPLRARVEPLHSVQLDAQEAGRVEAVYVREGDAVQLGQPLLKLHSPEQEQLLMQRGAEVAQQLANVALQRTAMTAALAAARRDLSQLRHGEEQAQAEAQRQRRLADQGFVSPAVLEQAERQQRLSQRLREQAEADLEQDATTRRRSLAEMDRAVQGLQQGLGLLQRARERLLLRAPIQGRLSGFTPRLGASLRAGEQLGRIDDLDSAQGGTRLLAEVDEYYLPRLQAGLSAHSALGPLRLTQTLPQVQGGKARLWLQWTGPAPAQLRPGQAVDLRLQFGPPGPALLLPDGPGVQARLYVRSGQALQARSVRLGRRAAGWVEVLDGLSAGEQVLISAAPALPSGAAADRLRLP